MKIRIFLKLSTNINITYMMRVVKRKENFSTVNKYLTATCVYIKCQLLYQINLAPVTAMKVNTIKKTLRRWIKKYEFTIRLQERNKTHSNLWCRQWIVNNPILMILFSVVIIIMRNEKVHRFCFCFDIE
jgi:hypothetical protein